MNKYKKVPRLFYVLIKINSVANTEKRKNIAIWDLGSQVKSFAGHNVVNL